MLKKWDAARVRYGGANGVTRQDIVHLYETEGYDVENDPVDLLRAIDTTRVVKADERLPFSASNLALRQKRGSGLSSGGNQVLAALRRCALPGEH